MEHHAEERQSSQDFSSSQDDLSSQKFMLSQNSHQNQEQLYASHIRLDVITNALGESPVKNAKPKRTESETMSAI